MTTRSKGIRGEHIARRFCLAHDMQIVESNWRAGRGEIDLIAKDGDCTVFIEVKYRTTTEFGHPFESITPHKQHMLRSTIAAYLKSHPTRQFRVDVLGVIHTQHSDHIEYIKDVELLPK